MEEKSPWDTNVMQWILYFTTGVWKGTTIFVKTGSSAPRPPHPIQCWNLGDFFNIVGGVGGEARQVKLYLRLARAQKR